MLTLMLCCICLPKNSLAKNVNPLIKCLGLEELAIHKKKVIGPVYKLNQHFINELSTLYGLTLKEDSLNRVCRQKAFSPSVNLLQELLLKGRKAFIIPKASIEGGPTALATSALDGFLDKTPHVFFTYLSQLQALAPLAPCLENKIPEIGYFMERYKYLEDISGSRGIIEKEQSKVRSIFTKLKNFDSIIKVCTREKEKQKAKK